MVYKAFSCENFKRDLSHALGISIDSFDDFDEIFTTKLNKNAPKKKKLMRGNSTLKLIQFTSGHNETSLNGLDLSV